MNSSELAEKLARRRKWEDGRPPPPPPPEATPSLQSRQLSGTHRAAPPPPSIPARTYRGKLSRDGSGQLSSRSLHSAGGSSTMHAPHGADDALNMHSLVEALIGGSISAGHSDANTRGSTRSLGSSDESGRSLLGGADDVHSEGERQRPVLLGKSGSNRHLMKQMEIINRTSPPSARVPQRTPPAVPLQHQGKTSVPTRVAPPAPVTLGLSIAETAVAAKPSPKPKRPAPLPPPQLEIKTTAAPVLHSTTFDVHHQAPMSPSTIGGIRKAPAVPPVPKEGHQLSSRTLQAMEEMNHLRPLLIKFYLAHKREKLPAIDKILAAYGMHGAIEGEEKLNEALSAEYGSDLRSITLRKGEETDLLREYQLATAKPSVNQLHSDAHGSGTAQGSPTAEAIAIMKEVVNDECDAAKLIFARAIYRFEPQEEGDLGFDIGQIIEVSDTSKDWWVGSYKGEHNKEMKGIFPKNYVEDISESIVLSLRAAEESSKEKSMIDENSHLLSPSKSPVSSSPAIMAAAHAAAARHRKNSTGSSPGSATVVGTANAALGVAVPEREAAAASEEADEYSPELVKDDIYATHYFKSVFEMASSEFKYVTDLFLANQAFVQPFMESLGRDRTETMMPSWGDILRVHERLLGMLMETLPDVRQLEKDFANNNLALMVAGKAQAGPIRRPSYVMENSELLDSVAGASAPALKSYAVRLDVLEDCYSRLLESGRFLSQSQRQERVSCISTWVTKQSDVFNKFAPFLKAANPFIANYHNAVETLESFSGEDLALLARLESNPLLKNLKLRDFLIKPVQRVCKYPLLYREMIKYAPEEDTKLVAIKAQSNLMTIADQVNTMMKLNESGNAKKLQAIKACIRPASDVDAYELHNAVLRREGEISVVGFQGSSHAPELRTMTTIAGVLQAKPKGSVRGLLFQEQLLLIEVQTKFITKAERYRIIHAFHITRSWESMKIDKQDTDGFSITLAHAPDGPAKGASITWRFKSPPAARDGWVEDLLEVSDRLEKVRERMSLARQQEAKTEHQRASKRKSNGSIDWDHNKLPSLPTVPTRRPKAQGGLFSLIDELKTVQSIKFDHVKKSIV